jgi:hypothetical protein
MKHLTSSLALSAVALLLTVGPMPLAAQSQETPLLTIFVVDPSGALIVGARVQVTAADRPQIDTLTGSNGAARIALTVPSRVDVHVESDGFEASDIKDLQVRRSTRRTVKLKLAHVYETVQVGRDARERASDPRSDIFSTVLGAAEIQELPDDPDEMERVLKEMAGPGAVMRVNGFRGGRLPPKDQIAQIRFRRNMFAADVHEPGFISVDVITKPGLENWRGSTGVALRDDVLNARNAFAPDKGDERHGRGSFTFSGPLWRKHTTLSIAVDGTNAYDTQTIVAALPSGAFADSVCRPNDAANVSARVEHALSSSQQLRAEVQRNHAFKDNLGVGNFDLPSRAYRQTRDETVARGSVAGSIRKSMFNEVRVSVVTSQTGSRSALQAPVVTVLNAFTSGGAQIDGGVASTVLEASDDLDISVGHHALRLGFLLQSGRYHTTELRNTIGTFTFSDLAAYDAQMPTTFTRTAGDPRASISATQVGTYVQDDLRVTPALTVSAGVRQEIQTTIGGLHLAPRGGMTWAPFKSGRTTVRAGAGIFYDWFDAESQLRARQLDGHHQQVETFLNPGYPIIPEGPATIRLENGRIQLGPWLEQPAIREANIGVEQTLRAVRLNVMAIHRTGSHELRGVDVNAPVGGVRPDPAAGPLTEVRSTASSSFNALSVNINVVRPDRRVFIAANYMLSRSINETDTPFSLPADAANPASERGAALDDARHRAMGFASFPLTRSVSAGISFTARSALPYDVTTGRDDNGDSISSDRPRGAARNAGRGSAVAEVSARVAWRLGFGGTPSAGPSGPQVRLVRRGVDSNPLSDMPGGETETRYALEIYAQAFNVLNHTNEQTFSGVMTSPFFGRAISAAPARRIELGARLIF